MDGSAHNFWIDSAAVYALSLDEVLASVWSLLQAAAKSRKEPFHQVTMATLAPDGAPSARVLTFRGIEPERRRFRVHSDRRHGVVQEIQADPRVCVMFYDPARKLQYRFHGRARIHTNDALADCAWDRTRLFSRRCYLAPEPPGAPSPLPTSGLPPAFETRNPEAEESEAGRANFAVITAVADRLDWLYLAGKGQRRAQFTWDAAGGVAATWLVP
mgnify:CR=1 FL=1